MKVFDVIEIFFKSMAVVCAMYLLAKWLLFALAGELLPQDNIDLLTAGVLLALSRE